MTITLYDVISPVRPALLPAAGAAELCGLTLLESWLDIYKFRSTVVPPM